MVTGSWEVVAVAVLFRVLSAAGRRVAEEEDWRCLRGLFLLIATLMVDSLGEKS
jgi:hypothetical protein